MPSQSHALLDASFWALDEPLADWLAHARQLAEDFELSTYCRWARRRLELNEDPRIAADFVAHLRALGADAADPHRYGFPYPATV